MESRTDLWQGDAHPLPEGDWTIVGMLGRDELGPLIETADGQWRLALESGGRFVWSVNGDVGGSCSARGRTLALRKRGTTMEVLADGRPMGGCARSLAMLRPTTVRLMRTAGGGRREFTVYGLALPDATLERSLALDQAA